MCSSDLDPLTLGEGHAGVESEIQAKRSDEIDRATVVEGRQRPVLGELISDDDCEGDHRGDRTKGLHRRPMPPTRSSTSSVVHGNAFRRSRGIGLPEWDE